MRTPRTREQVAAGPMSGDEIVSGTGHVTYVRTAILRHFVPNPDPKLRDLPILTHTTTETTRGVVMLAAWRDLVLTWAVTVNPARLPNVGANGDPL